MYPDGLTESEKLKVKELCTVVNVSDEDALKLSKENDNDIQISSRRVSKQEDKTLVPGTSKEDVDLERLSSRLRVRVLAFYLPDFGGFPNEFRTFLEKDLIETQTQKRATTRRCLENKTIMNRIRRIKSTEVSRRSTSSGKNSIIKK
ncbi:hypothetical protein B9Z55_027247 [Caenorhabditis nigoni]|uniref:Uncharacterized protein n=1 Tax=Caenorhabditis nigoni TaxID=1611254 RepID=A0A2G5SH80_9PELO|nr:hypothetical protein B9Z55_027247 [Caenorhabditis nigoni]